MSLCRWSSDSFRCDLYVYEDVGGGYMVHVASQRVPDGGPVVTEPRDWKDPAEVQRWMDERGELMQWLDELPLEDRKPIGLKHDGESFREPTAKALKQRLMVLRELGYRFPEGVMAQVNELVEEEANE